MCYANISYCSYNLQRDWIVSYIQFVTQLERIVYTVCYATGSYRTYSSLRNWIVSYIKLITQLNRIVQRTCYATRLYRTFNTQLDRIVRQIQCLIRIPSTLSDTPFELPSRSFSRDSMSNKGKGAIVRTGHKCAYIFFHTLLSS